MGAHAYQVYTEPTDGMILKADDGYTSYFIYNPCYSFFFILVSHQNNSDAENSR